MSYIAPAASCARCSLTVAHNHCWHQPPASANTNANITTTGLLYCAEFLEENFEWLETRVRALKGA